MIDGKGKVTEPLLISALDKEFGENNYSIADSSDGKYWVVTKDSATENIIKPSSIPAENYKTFKYHDKTYKYDEGMTWAEWIESDYNTEGWRVIWNPSDYPYWFEVGNICPLSAEEMEFNVAHEYNLTVLTTYGYGERIVAGDVISSDEYGALGLQVEI